MMERFQVVIAGGRDFNDYPLLVQQCDHFFQNKKPTAIISGLARGADLLGKRYAEERGIRILEYPANWAKYGKSAGMIRNREMLADTDAVIVFWDGVSRGTKNMIDITRGAGKPLRVVNYKNKR